MGVFVDFELAMCPPFAGPILWPVFPVQLIARRSQWTVLNKVSHSPHGAFFFPCAIALYVFGGFFSSALLFVCVTCLSLFSFPLNNKFVVLI